MKILPPKVWVITVFLILSISFYGLSSLFPEKRLWAFDHLSYVPPVLRWFWISAGIAYVILIGGLASRAVSPRQSSPLSCLGLSGVLTTRYGVFAMGVVGVILFVSMNVSIDFLGDGYMIVNSLHYFLDHPTFQINPEFYIRHPLTSFFYILSVYAISLVAEVDIGLYLRMFSYLAGLVFVVIVLKFLRKWGNDKLDVLMGSAFLFLNATILLFFGYIENYAFAFVMVVLYLFVSMRYLSKKGKLLPVLVTCVFAVAFHLSSVLLLPSLAYLLLLHLESRRGRPFLKPLQIVGLVGMSLLGLSAFYLLNGSYKTFDHLLHSVSGPGLSQYTLFSEFHLVDLVNEIALISPLVPLSVLTLLLYGGWNFSLEKRMFLLLTAVYGLVFLFIANPELGLARDWDAFAVVGIILNFVALITIAAVAIPQAYKRFIAAAFVGYGIWVIVPWIYVNSDERASVARYEKILAMDADVILPKDVAYGYEGLAGYYRGKGDQVNELLVVDRMSDYQQRPRYYIVLRNLVFQLDRRLVDDSMIAKNLRKMREYSQRVRPDRLVRVDSLFLVAFCDLTAHWANRGYIADALEYATELEGRFPSVPRVQALLARMNFLGGSYQKAVSHFELVAALDSSFVLKNPKFIASWGLSYRYAGNPLKAAEVYERALQLHPQVYDLYLTLGNIYTWDLRDPKKGRNVWERLVQIAPESPEGQKAQEELSSR